MSRTVLACRGCGEPLARVRASESVEPLDRTRPRFNVKRREVRLVCPGCGERTVFGHAEWGRRHGTIAAKTRAVDA